VAVSLIFSFGSKGIFGFLSSFSPMSIEFSLLFHHIILTISSPFSTLCRFRILLFKIYFLFFSVFPKRENSKAIDKRLNCQSQVPRQHASGVPPWP
jgi:hypothetical protein